jgi:hypothetical protein
MRTKMAGALLLALIAVLLVVLGAARSRQVPGIAEPITPPAPPAVGSCLDQDREPVDCAASHRWEVVAAWAADDPRRPVEATADTCERTAETYPGIVRARTVGEWTARATMVTAVLDAPTDQRAGPNLGWTACGVQPAWIDRRHGSIAAARSIADIPDLFGLCLDHVVDTGGSDCRMPHDEQVLGSWNDAAVGRALRAGAVTVQQLSRQLQTAATQACLTFAASLTNAEDPTYGRRLDYLVVIQDGSRGQPVLNCLVTPTNGQVLVGSITALGDRPVPLR